MCSEKNRRFKSEHFQHDNRNKWIEKINKNIYYGTANINVVVANGALIESGIMINVGVKAKIQKNIMRVKNVIFGILLHVL